MLRNPIHLLRGHLSRMFVFLKAQPKECISNGGISGLREVSLRRWAGGEEDMLGHNLLWLVGDRGSGAVEGWGEEAAWCPHHGHSQASCPGGPGSLRRVKRRALCGAGASASLGRHPAPVQARFTSLPGVGCTPAPLACPALRSALVFCWEEPIERREPWA